MDVWQTIWYSVALSAVFDTFRNFVSKKGSRVAKGDELLLQKITVTPFRIKNLFQEYPLSTDDTNELCKGYFYFTGESFVSYTKTETSRSLAQSVM